MVTFEGDTLAYSWDLDSEESISLDELIEFLDGQGENVLNDNLEFAAMMMRKLYNNRTFLSETILRQLADERRFDSINPYTPQVFMLHRADHYFIRAAIWIPPTGITGEEIFFYEDPHDHNFALLTLGYEGPGYETVLFEYDHQSVIGDVGEKVEVRFLERTRLSRGRVMFYRDSQDIHVQFPSENFSISINVVVPKMQMSRQYSFDLDLSPQTTCATIRENLIFHTPTIISRFAHDLGVSNVPEILRGHVAASADQSAQRIADEFLRALEV
ncbi:hypothetical protein D3C81_314920 [compost metagenome]|uniref:hypothetical protein n=1 Tax=Stenotrophomonas lactitubi TaxID=2045214 RepID=UPI000FA8541F|nr:hypothetical protein [Stenotrophomonas maltophilia]